MRYLLQIVIVFYSSFFFISIPFAEELHFPDGSTKAKYSQVDGKYHGKYEECYENGKLKECGVYKNGEKIGIWKLYTEEGNIINEINYNNSIDLDIGTEDEGKNACSKPDPFMSTNWGLSFRYHGEEYYRNNSNLRKIINKSDCEEAQKELKEARKNVICIWTLPFLVVTLPFVSIWAKNIWIHRNSAIDYYNTYIYSKSKNGCSDDYITNE